MFHRQYLCTGHRSALYSLANSHQARHFLSAGGDGWITEWDIDNPETGRVVSNVESQVFSLAISPPEWPEPCILAGNMLGGLHWINLLTPALTRNVLHHQKGIFDILWIGHAVFTAGGDGMVTRWDASLKKSVESFQLSNRSIRSLAYSPAHDLIAAGAGDGNIYLLRRSDFSLRQTIAAHDNSVFCLAWSPDQQHLFSGGRDAHLKVWNISGENEHSLPAHLFTINHITFSPDGTYCATASRDKTIKIWDAATLQLVKVLETMRDHGHLNSVNRLLWTPDYLLSCSDDRTVIMWQK